MPRGRVLGGTSSLNGMVYLRGAASDYDGWAAAGCPGWEWTAVREAFAGLEAWQRPAVLSEHNPLSQAMVDGRGRGRPCPTIRTSTTGRSTAAGWNKSTIAEGARVNAHRAFVAPVRDRPNLHVLPNVRVLGLAMDGTTARGVVVQEGGGRTETIAAGETILCAGAFDSPRLLLLSGIGRQRT
jgi:choline dehydrogenase-like flavoprotein